MNWRTQKEGDRRGRIFFAWLPTRASDGRTYWWERMWKRQTLICGYDGCYWCNDLVYPLADAPLLAEEESGSPRVDP